MKKLSSEEVLLTGEWQTKDGMSVANGRCERIERLVSSDLMEIGTDDTAWEKLYQDPTDGRFWILCYPNSDSHGSGPASLRVITPDEAREKAGAI